ncbi:MAG TPA: acetamidase/formamidase family protein [Gemmatimonadaceae bacterium]
MSTRRRFVASAPLAVMGVIAACNDGAGAAPGAAAPNQGSVVPPRPAVPKGIASIPAGAPTLSWIPKHEELVYTFGGAAPRQRIKPGTRIVTWTEDCFDGAVKTAADLPSKTMTAGHDNPQTGPFYVEGAEPGDTVAIHILKLEPARSYAVSSFGPGFGALVGNDQTAMLGPDFPEMTWRYDVDAKRNVARASSRDGKHSWEVPLAPFFGCLGVAPAGGEVRTTIVPGNFGGNMDCPEVRPGNTVFLGVNVPGALVSFGDGHYAMGDGEIMGAAIEGAMNVEVYVELIKKTATPIPRIENADEIMFVGSGRPLEDAARVAFKAMIGWVRERSGMSVMDSYQFVSQNAKAPVIQLVDPEYTMLVKLEKGRVPGGARGP